MGSRPRPDHDAARSAPTYRSSHTSTRAAPSRATRSVTPTGTPRPPTDPGLCLEETSAAELRDGLLERDRGAGGASVYIINRAYCLGKKGITLLLDALFLEKKTK